MRKAEKRIILKVGEMGQNINFNEIYEIIKPMDKNPSSCETYEKILTSKKVLKLVEKMVLNGL